MRSLSEQMLKVPTVLIAGLRVSVVSTLLLIFALCLNFPRPVGVFSEPSDSVIVKLNHSEAPLNTHKSKSQTTNPNQNSANTYEEIHGESLSLVSQAIVPHFSYLVSPHSVFMYSIESSKIQRPPRV